MDPHVRFKFPKRILVSKIRTFPPCPNRPTLTPSSLLLPAFRVGSPNTTMREIVTVQVGSFANYIGSHLWNFQDELLGVTADQNGQDAISSLNMDVLYRSGETPQGNPTYTPRLISIGSKGSLGFLRPSGSLYGDSLLDDESNVVTWTGKISRQVAEPHKRNLFLKRLYEDDDREEPSVSEPDLENDNQAEFLDKDIVECLKTDVNFWTDFSKVHHHPRSLYELSCSWIDIQDFDNYGIGRDIFSSNLQGEEIVDRLRFFVEECNHIQGFQFIVDDSGGFSSVAADFLETIADDYGKTPVLLYTARDPLSYVRANSRRQIVSSCLHDAISFSRLSSSCTLISPIGLSSLSTSKLSALLSIDDTNPFHTSAVYAASIHSISLPFRMERLGATAHPMSVSGAMDIHECIQMLTDQARQNMVAVMDVAMPSPPLTGDHIHGSFQNSLCPLTPEVAADAEDLLMVESVVIHGALHSGEQRASISEMHEAYYSGYQDGLTRPLFSHLSAAVFPLPLPLSFPSIFASHVGWNGELLGTSSQRTPLKGPLEINSIPMASRLRSTSAILPFINKRLENLQRFGIKRGAAGTQLLENWGFAKEEVDEMGEVLAKMVMSLDPHPEISSDSD